MVVRCGRFGVTVPRAWATTVRHRDDGVLVLAPAADATGSGLMRAGLTLRCQEAGRGGDQGSGVVGPGWPDRSGWAQSVVLAVAQGRSDAGAPVRSCHAATWAEAGVVHRLWWQVEAAGQVLEVCLGVHEALLGTGLPETVAGVVHTVQLLDSGETKDGDPAETEAQRGPGKGPGATALGHAPDLSELLAGSAIDGGPVWSEVDGDTGDRIRSDTPVMRAMGVCAGKPMICAVHSVGSEALMARSVLWGAPGSETWVREVAYTPVPAAPLKFLAALGVRPGGPDDLYATTGRTADLVAQDLEWDVQRGGENAVRALYRPRDAWVVVDGDGGLVAEWCQPEGSGPLAVFRKDEAVVVRAMDTRALYSRFCQVWGRQVAERARG